MSCRRLWRLSERPSSHCGAAHPLSPSLGDPEQQEEEAAQAEAGDADGEEGGAQGGGRGGEHARGLRELRSHAPAA